MAFWPQNSRHPASQSMEGLRRLLEGAGSTPLRSVGALNGGSCAGRLPVGMRATRSSAVNDSSYGFSRLEASCFEQPPLRIE